MNKHIKTLLIVMLVFFATSSMSLANSYITIYDGGGPTNWPLAQMNTRINAEDFTLDANYIWTDVHFYTMENTDSPNAWDGITLNYYVFSDNNNMPTTGSPLLSGSATNIVKSSNGLSAPASGLTGWEYSFDLETPVDFLQPATKYWLALQLDADLDLVAGTTPALFWAMANDGNDYYNYWSNSLSFTSWTANGNANGKSEGLGFYLTGTPVPEPSTFLLLGGGLAGLVFIARRKRT